MRNCDDMIRALELTQSEIPLSISPAQHYFQHSAKENSLEASLKFPVTRPGLLRIVKSTELKSSLVICYRFSSMNIRRICF